MIEINVKPYEMVISGHSGYGEYGKDIVCASISCLYLTLCESMKKNDADIADLKISYVSGNGNIKCRPVRNKAKIDAIWETVINGMRKVEELYPDNVKIIIGQG